MKKSYVIIGNGAAGISTIEALRRLDRHVRIIVVSEETCVAYSKVFLHNYVAGEIAQQDLFIRQEAFYRDFNVDTFFGKRAIHIDADQQLVHFEDGLGIEFDKLLICTGSRPWRPPIQGVDRDGVYTFWTLEDSRQIRQTMKNCRRSIVIGAGFVGMQAVDALIKCGIGTTLVDTSERMMPQSLDVQSSEIVQTHLEKCGVRVILGSRPVEIQSSEKVGKIVILEDGRELTGDIIIVATGARPNINLVKRSRVETNIGVIVDCYLRSSYSNIFAAGDVAETIDTLTGQRKAFGLWTTAVTQGRIAGLNMGGKKVEYQGGIDMNSITILGLPVATIGRTVLHGDINCISEEVFLNRDKKMYRKFVFKKNELVGAILIGNVKDAGLIGEVIRSRREILPENHCFSLGRLIHSPSVRT
jgi:NAD(P)H-nitrite reductase large subunit